MSEHTVVRYIFSGGLSSKMVEYFQNIEEFEPIDVLVSQLDRSSIKQMLVNIEKGVVKSLFIDSGAYSQYTGQIKEIDVDEYIDYVNSLDEHVISIAQVDTLPGKFGKPKSPEDYIDSSEKSWKNYLYMRTKLKSPQKLIPVFHYGEPFSALKRMLEYRDENGQPVGIIGLSPANDSGQNVKDLYLKECYDIIRASSQPNARTHLFGMTSLDSLQRFPCYSADSVSHRLRSAYNKVFTRKWGTISLSDKTRTNKTKSNQSFLRLADEDTLKEFEALANSYGFTSEQLKNDNAARVCMDVCEIQKALKETYYYHPDKEIKKVKRLF